jgi:hypothetical protein
MVVTLYGIEIDGEFKEAVIEAIAMKDLPYTIRIHKNKYREVEQWCKEHIGERWGAIDNRDGNWCCFWAGREDFAGYNFHFAREEDMIWVALKWL